MVVGGGDTAMEEATLPHAARPARSTVVHRRDALRASKIMQERALKNPKIDFVWNTRGGGRPTRPRQGDDGRAPREPQDRRGLASSQVDGLFVAIGHQPNTALFKGQLDLHANGYIKVRRPGPPRPRCRACSRPATWPTSRYRQAVTAAGTGCMAALEAERYLEAQGLE